MAVLQFTFTGQVEVDADAIGIAFANQLRVDSEDPSTIFIEGGFRFREDSALSMEILLRQGLTLVMERHFGKDGYRTITTDAEATQIA